MDTVLLKVMIDCEISTFIQSHNILFNNMTTLHSIELLLPDYPVPRSNTIAEK